MRIAQEVRATPGTPLYVQAHRHFTCKVVHLSERFGLKAVRSMRSSPSPHPQTQHHLQQPRLPCRQVCHHLCPHSRHLALSPACLTILRGAHDAISRFVVTATVLGHATFEIIPSLAPSGLVERLMVNVTLDRIRVFLVTSPCRQLQTQPHPQQRQHRHRLHRNRYRSRQTSHRTQPPQHPLSSLQRS